MDCRAWISFAGMSFGKSALMDDILISVTAKPESAERIDEQREERRERERKRAGGRPWKDGECAQEPKGERRVEWDRCKKDRFGFLMPLCAYYPIHEFLLRSRGGLPGNAF